MNHRTLALITWLLSWALAIGGGGLFAHTEHISFGLGTYWAITTVETVGYGDITPHTIFGHWVASGTMLLAIPIWSLAFGFATSFLTSLHVWHAHDSIKEHVTSEVNK